MFSWLRKKTTEWQFDKSLIDKEGSGNYEGRVVMQCAATPELLGLLSYLKGSTLRQECAEARMIK